VFPLIIAGFGKPRSFLYLAPVVTTILTLFLHKRICERRLGSAIVMSAFILLSAGGAIANINHGSAPFKRNSVIPYQEILDFIHLNAHGRVLVVSTDPVVVWTLQHSKPLLDGCVTLFVKNRQCFDSAQQYNTVFTVVGHSNLSGVPEVMHDFDSAIATITAGKQKVADLNSGLDEDAALKSKLTGVPLRKYLLSIGLYR